MLTQVIKRRFGLGPGGIVFKVTIAAPVVVISHFEPLRYYAEVHLLLKLGERGSDWC